MLQIPDYTETELDTIRTLLKRRYKEDIEVHLADAEVRLDPRSGDLTECPAAYWYARQCNFVVVKSGASEYRCQFFHDPGDQFGTGRPQYSGLEECVTALLQVQSDHERAGQAIATAPSGGETR